MIITLQGRGVNIEYTAIDQSQYNDLLKDGFSRDNLYDTYFANFSSEGGCLLEESTMLVDGQQSEVSIRCADTVSPFFYGPSRYFLARIQGTKNENREIEKRAKFNSKKMDVYTEKYQFPDGEIVEFIHIDYNDNSLEVVDSDTQTDNFYVFDSVEKTRSSIAFRES